MNALEFFGRGATYDTPIEVAPGIRATYFDAGHILGSASILLELEEGGTRRRVVMSGDIGNAGRPLLDPPKQPPQCDVVVMETTYGDRHHKPFGPSVEEFYAAIEETFRRGGNVVIIPTFALERAQELLYALHDAMMSNDRLPRAIQVFLDSPMAISATEIFRRHPECLSDEVAELFRDGRDPLAVPGLHLTRESAEFDGDQQDQRRRDHHGRLGHGDRRASAPSPQAQSLAIGCRRDLRRLCRAGHAGAPHHRRGQDGPHLRRGDPGEGQNLHDRRLLRPRGPERTACLARASGAARTFLVHGDETVMKTFAPLLKDTEAVMPAMNESFEL